MVVRSDKVVEIIYKSLIIQSALNICPNYNYLHKVTYIRVKTKEQQKKWGERKDQSSQRAGVMLQNNL